MLTRARRLVFRTYFWIGLTAPAQEFSDSAQARPREKFRLIHQVGGRGKVERKGGGGRGSEGGGGRRRG